MFCSPASFLIWKKAAFCARNSLAGNVDWQMRNIFDSVFQSFPLWFLQSDSISAINSHSTPQGRWIECQVRTVRENETTQSNNSSTFSYISISLQMQFVVVFDLLRGGEEELGSLNTLSWRRSLTCLPGEKFAMQIYPYIEHDIAVAENWQKNKTVNCRRSIEVGSYVSPESICTAASTWRNPLHLVAWRCHRTLPSNVSTEFA